MRSWLKILLFSASGLLAACSQDHKNAAQEISSNRLLTHAMARGRVDVEGGLLELRVPVRGQVSHLEVGLGQDIHRGQQLLDLDAQNAKLGLALAQGELAHARAAAAVLQAALPHLRRDSLRQEAAAHSGLGSEDDAEQAATRLAEQIARLQLAQSDIELAQIRLDQARHRLKQYSLSAPIDGRIVELHAQTGALLDPQDSLAAMVIAPQRPLIVHAEVNEAFINRLHRGQAARVDIDLDGSSEHYDARLEHIGEMLVKGHLSEDPQMAHAFDCQLTLLPHPHQAPLRIGQTVMVTFL